MAKNRTKPRAQNAQSEVRNVPIDQLTVNPAYSVRTDYPSDVIARYRERLDQLPALTVYDVDGALILVSGFLRFEAHRIEERAEIPCEVLQGTQEEAQAFAACANAKHGVPMKPHEFRNACEMLLSLGWGVDAIADALGRSQRWADRYRCGLQVKAVVGNRTGLNDTIIEAFYPAGEHLWEPLAKIATRRRWNSNDIREVAVRCSEDPETVQAVHDAAKNDYGPDQAPLTKWERYEAERRALEAQRQEAEAKAQEEQAKREEAEAQADDAQTAAAEAQAAADAAQAEAEADDGESEASGADVSQPASIQGVPATTQAAMESSNAASARPTPPPAQGRPAPKPAPEANEPADNAEFISEALGFFIDDVVPLRDFCSADEAADVFLQNASMPQEARTLADQLSHFNEWLSDMLTNVYARLGSEGGEPAAEQPEDPSEEQLAKSA